MDERIILLIVGILSVLVMAGVIRYKSAAEAQFSVGNWVKFLFRGSNQPEKGDSAKTGIKLETGAQFVAKEVVGGDKITHIHGAGETSTRVELPKLVLRLFDVKVPAGFKEQIVISQEDAMRFGYCAFGLALENETESTTAKGVGLRVQFYWRGYPPHYAIIFQCPHEIKEWTTLVNSLRNDQPAVLTFTGPDVVCFYGQPVRWSRFRINLRERLQGHLLVRYTISSVQPQAASSGELRIVFPE